jgi:hypothetical protein
LHTGRSRALIPPGVVITFITIPLIWYLKKLKIIKSIKLKQCRTVKNNTDTMLKIIFGRNDKAKNITVIKR